ncbi:hypothetical protein SAMN04488034_11132 [Salinimicrobium catena]|uniref:Uncharacterized protein n=1 Tax=Salinimicrobium catena TaxID=390640 RepID=A0A1H5PAX6_9FLAO|nr:hypothetical protein [Salinimicrobium catena]SDL77441.1 hypothetical protein SAMN04488140_11132 [Salinimicrobium catena]SEF11073.1 hypothetical protein SAMN04488034_11132 [Salinimicrobium catena]
MEKRPENRKLKLIWDFHGPDAERTAQHHAIHLKEYLLKNGSSSNISGSESVSDNHFIAYLVIEEKLMPPVRDALKPHRGQVYNG